MIRSLALILAALCAACSEPAPTEEQVNRIVTVGGDVTEIVYALGAGDRVVATDSTSVYPEAANATPKVGYVRQLSAEGVLATNPELILISGAAGPEEALEQIRAVGVEIVEMPADYSVDGIIAKVRQIAAAIGEEERGEKLAAEIESDRAELQREVAAFGESPEAFFFTTLREGVPQAAGSDTAADGVIRMIGGRNLFGSQNGYNPISSEAAVTANPDLIFVMSHDVQENGGIEVMRARPEIALTDAVREGRLIEVDSVRVMQFGPRAPAALAELAQQIRMGALADE